MRLQTMKKTLLVILGVLTGFSAAACQGGKTTTTADIIIETDATIPAITNPDDIFYDGGTYQVTYLDLYEEMKANEGLTQLLDMVDRVLLASYYDQVTETEIANKINYLKYGTEDEAEIALFTVDEVANMENTYNETMTLAGFNGDEESYVKLIVAKENFALEALTLSANAEETWFVGPSAVAAYYQERYFEDISTIKIRFMSETEAKDVMKSLNLVGRQGSLYLYTGTKPIGDVPSSGFNEENTVLLEGAELLTAYIQMYNIVYGGYRSAISEDATFEELLANVDLKVNYIDQRTYNPTLNTFMYRTLGALETYMEDDTTPQYYTYVPVKFYTGSDTAYYMILNLQNNENVDLTDFDGDETELKSLIGADLYDEIFQILIDENYEKSGFISQRITDLRSAHNFVILDYYLGMDYQAVDTAFELDPDGHETLVAKYDDTEISADDLFYYAMNRNASLYLVYAAQVKVLMDQYFAEVYCDSETVCERDIKSNTSVKMESHRTALTEMKTSFTESYYSYYYTFEEYIYLAYGATSEDEMLQRYYVESTLQPHLVYDKLQENDWEILNDFLSTQIDEYYDNYFSLDVRHLLIFVDRNEDGAPDDYDQFKADLEDEAAYDILLEGFQSAIYTYLDNYENTFSDLLLVYSKAKHTDPIWGQYKNYGFYLMTEELSASASLTYLTSKDTYDPQFVVGLEDAYQSYILPENVNKATILYDEPIDTAFGSHILLVSKGDNFTKPSAKFTMTYNTDSSPKYTVGIDNANTELSLEQLKIYAEYRFIEMVYGTNKDTLTELGVVLPVIPSSVKAAIDAFFKDIHDSIYVIGTINVVVADSLALGECLNVPDDNFSFTGSDILANVAIVGQIYYNQVFTTS